MHIFVYTGTLDLSSLVQQQQWIDFTSKSFMAELGKTILKNVPNVRLACFSASMLCFQRVLFDSNVFRICLVQNLFPA